MVFELNVSKRCHLSPLKCLYLHQSYLLAWGLQSIHDRNMGSSVPDISSRVSIIFVISMRVCSGILLCPSCFWRLMSKRIAADDFDHAR